MQLGWLRDSIFGYTHTDCSVDGPLNYALVAEMSY